MGPSDTASRDGRVLSLFTCGLRGKRPTGWVHLKLKGANMVYLMKTENIVIAPLYCGSIPSYCRFNVHWCSVHSQRCDNGFAEDLLVWPSMLQREFRRTRQ